MALVEFEHAYYDVAFQYVSHNATGTSNEDGFTVSLIFSDMSTVFLSLRVFGLLSSSLLLFPQRFGRYVKNSSISDNSV